MFSKKIIIICLLLFIIFITKYFNNKENFNINSLSNSNKTVRILSQDINIDWKIPYKNKSNNKSIGSGFFIDNKGHILTCSHVVDTAHKIFIELPMTGDKKYEVKIISICPILDIALLKTVDYINKEFFELHKPEVVYNLKSGIDVYALGFPLGEDNIKITKGIISGKSLSLFQTDTNLNSGNSGGPLIYKNKVLGINSSGIIKQNIGYAIPISYFYSIKNQIFKTKLIYRPQLEIEYNNTNELLLKSRNSKCKNGIYISKLYKNSPLLKIGVKEGDILCKINDIQIDNNGLLNKLWMNDKMNINDLLNRTKNNEIISIIFSRNNKIFKKKILFKPKLLPIRIKYNLFENIDYEIFGGLIITELNLNFLKTMKFNNLKNKSLLNLSKYLKKENRYINKIVITNIFPNSIIENMETFHVGDIITEINNIKVNTINDVRETITQTKHKQFLTLKTELGTKNVISVNEIVNEEKELSKIYKYEISKLFI